MLDDMSTLLNKLTGGKADDAFKLLYGDSPRSLELHRLRYFDLIHNFSLTFPGGGEIEMFSTPGRTEVGGNHTDHNAGRVLAAAIDLDIVAATLIRKSSPEVYVFLNQGHGKSWNKTVVAAGKSAYKAMTGDIDNDGDIDIISSSSWDQPPIQLWRNTMK